MKILRKRSVVWSYFELIDASSVHCVLCDINIRRKDHGSTTPLLRHLRLKHSAEIPGINIVQGAEREIKKKEPGVMEVDDEEFCVEVDLEDGSSCAVNTVNYSKHIGLLETSREDASDHPKNVEVLVKPSRRRSLIWRIFEQLDSSGSACCRICEKKLSGGISNLRRHLSTKHPEVLSELLSSAQQPPEDSSQALHADDLAEDVNLETEQIQGPEDVFTEEGNSEVESRFGKTAHASLRDSAQQPTNTEMGDSFQEQQPRRKSLIWQYFNRLTSLNAACCRICMTKLQCPEGGGTSNLHRHLSKRHPKVFSELAVHRQISLHSNIKKNSNAYGTIEKKLLAIQERAPLEDSDSNSVGTLNETEYSIVNGTTETLEEQSPQQAPHSDDSLHKQTQKRSLIWKYFEQLASLKAVRCCLCMKKIQYFDHRSTGNLHRHLAKRHPKLIPEVVSVSMNEPKLSGLSENQKRLFSRERELIEALRRTQREEAQTLEHQRELLEKLRAVSAREAAAEREEIELLRKAQQKEAKDLERQQEELAKGKVELQKKWEELQLNKEKFF